MERLLVFGWFWGVNLLGKIKILIPAGIIHWTTKAIRIYSLVKMNVNTKMYANPFYLCTDPSKSWNTVLQDQSIGPISLATDIIIPRATPLCG